MISLLKFRKFRYIDHSRNWISIRRDEILQISVTIVKAVRSSKVVKTWLEKSRRLMSPQFVISVSSLTFYVRHSDKDNYSCLLWRFLDKRSRTSALAFLPFFRLSVEKSFCHFRLRQCRLL